MPFNTFLRIDGLGGATTPGAPAAQATSAGPHQIEVLSFSWGASNPAALAGAGAGTGAGAGKVSISALNLMRLTDQMSPTLFLACAQGTHYKSAALTLVRAGGGGNGGGPGKGGPAVPFIEWDFADLVVQSIQWSGSSGGDGAPSESISLAFAKVMFKFAGQNPDGSATNAQTGWDLTTNQQV